MSFAFSSYGIVSRFCKICSNFFIANFNQSTMYNKSVYTRVMAFSVTSGNSPIVLNAGLCYTDRVSLTGKWGSSCAVVGWYR